jgi:hypothetical protein
MTTAPPAPVAGTSAPASAVPGPALASPAAPSSPVGSGRSIGCSGASGRSRRPVRRARPPPGGAARPAPGAKRPAPPPSVPTGSPVGIGLARAIVQFHGPRHRVTDRAVEPLAGRVIGPLPERFTLHVNGIPQPVTVEGNRFEAVGDPDAGMKPGASGRDRARRSRDGGFRHGGVCSAGAKSQIVLVAPTDGLRRLAEDPPYVVVEGKVDNKTIGIVSVVVNGRQTAVPVREGRFRQIVPASEPVLKIWAEGVPADGPGSGARPSPSTRRRRPRRWASSSWIGRRFSPATRWRSPEAGAGRPGGWTSPRSR